MRLFSLRSASKVAAVVFGAIAGLFLVWAVLKAGGWDEGLFRAAGIPIESPSKGLLEAAYQLAGAISSGAVSLGSVLAARILPEHRVSEIDPHKDKHNRDRVLRAGEHFWVEGLLKHSLHEKVLIALGMEDSPMAVKQPLWVFQGSRPSDRTSPSDTNITGAFERVDKALLILGEPGSGKTTVLCELARNLIARARQDDYHPIPVVLKLSSWAEHRLSIAEWVIAEMRSFYQVDSEVGRIWINNERLVLLLDSLDEVPQEYQQECVVALNQFRQEHRADMVVCSRIVEYENLQATGIQLELNGGITLQPLTDDQIADYLTELRGDFTDILRALRKDAEIKKLAATPLILNILIITSKGNVFDGMVDSGTSEERRHQLFNAYVRYMITEHRLLERPSIREYNEGPNVDPEQGESLLENPHKMSRRFGSDQTLGWLKWLARMMRQHNQGVFLIEGLQPSWLSGSAQQRFHKLCFKVAGGVGALVVMIALFAFSSIRTGLLLDLSSIWTWIVLLEILVAVIFGAWAGSGLAKRDIKVEEGLSWSWSKAVAGALSTLVGALGGLLVLAVLALIIGVIFGFGFVQDIIKDPIGMLGVLFVFLPLVLLIPIILGVSRTEVKLRVHPNEGVRRSLRNAVWMGLVSALSVHMVSLLSLYFVVGGSDEGWGRLFSASLVLSPFSLGVGVWTAFYFGGLSCLQHLILRIALWRYGQMPWNYAAFLNYATDRVLLRRVGGGYIFVHQLLLDYFAELEGNPTSAVNASERNREESIER